MPSGTAQSRSAAFAARSIESFPLIESIQSASQARAARKLAEPTGANLSAPAMECRLSGQGLLRTAGEPLQDGGIDETGTGRTPCASAGPGCANQQLRFSTLRQTSTLADLQEAQVVENFARLAANPGSLPFLAVANSGSATITDGGSGSLSFLGAHKIFTSGTYGLGANRSVQLNWGLAPLNNPDRLKAMKAAYLSVIDPALVDPNDAYKLHQVIGQDPSYAMAGGWLETGRWWSVPRHAWRVGHCGRTYVWVMPEHAEDFTRFVLLTLNLASVQPGASGAHAARAMTTAPGAPPVHRPSQPRPTRSRLACTISPPA